MIRVDHLTKKYGSKVAVNDLSFELRSGAVTGFLGPNGSGKSTTMRCIVGLDRPTSGRATIGGKEYRELSSPLTTVGALLDGKAFHRKRTARQHLVNVARTHGFPLARVDEVLALTGLDSVAKKKVGGFSLGMSQRLGIAGALLGDPEVLLFDEPVNGLDPDGVRWVRNLMRSLASEGRTVLVSSHLMSEMALTADDLIVIGRGELIAQGPISQFTASAQRTATVVAGPDMDAIERALSDAGFPCRRWAADAEHPFGLATVVGVKGRELGPALHAAGCELHELSEIHSSLEDVYMELTSGSLEYSIGSAASPAPAGHAVGPGFAGQEVRPDLAGQTARSGSANFADYAGHGETASLAPDAAIASHPARSGESFAQAAHDGPSEPTGTATGEPPTQAPAPPGFPNRFDAVPATPPPVPDGVHRLEPQAPVPAHEAGTAMKEDLR